MIKRFLFLINFIFCSVTALAASTTVPIANSPVPATSVVKPDLCPEMTTLTKEGLLWSAPEGWVSYGESFDTKALRFVKAEWIGINYGKIICIYRGDKRIAFPIALEQKQTKLAPSPSGSAWSKDLGGRKECIADTIKDCPFYFKKENKPENIYEDLDFFKGKSDQDY